MATPRLHCSRRRRRPLLLLAPLHQQKTQILADLLQPPEFGGWLRWGLSAPLCSSWRQESCMRTRTQVCTEATWSVRVCLFYLLLQLREWGVLLDRLNGSLGNAPCPSGNLLLSRDGLRLIYLDHGLLSFISPKHTSAMFCALLHLVLEDFDGFVADLDALDLLKVTLLALGGCRGVKLYPSRICLKSYGVGWVCFGLGVRGSHLGQDKTPPDVLYPRLARIALSCCCVLHAW